MSLFFTPDLLTNFQNNLESLKSDALQGLRLMSGKDAKRLFQKAIMDPVPSIALQCRMACKGCIEKDYLETAVGNALNGANDEVDMALLVKHDPSLPVSRKPVDGSAENFDVISFLVVEKGECKKWPKTLSVNLICAREFENFKNAGRIMMALFCYVILSSNRLDQRGVLEVAGGYQNPGAFCMYQKFGFQPDLSLFSDENGECFDSGMLVPMVVDFVYENRDEQKRKVLEAAVLSGANIGSKDRMCDIRVGQILYAFLTQWQILKDRGDEDEMDDHNNAAASLSMATGLSRQMLPKLKPFLAENRAAENPVWTNYLNKLSSWFTEQLIDETIICAKKQWAPHPGPMPKDLIDAIAGSSRRGGKRRTRRRRTQGTKGSPHPSSSSKKREREGVC